MLYRALREVRDTITPTPVVVPGVEEGGEWVAEGGEWVGADHGTINRRTRPAW